MIPAPLLTVRPLNVVAPVSDCKAVPLSVTVPVPAVKLPEFVQFPFSVMPFEPADTVVPEPIVRLPLAVTAPPRVLVPPPLVTRLL